MHAWSPSTDVLILDRRAQILLLLRNGQQNPAPDEEPLTLFQAKISGPNCATVAAVARILRPSPSSSTSNPIARTAC